jgi:hypothetical protein
MRRLIVAWHLYRDRHLSFTLRRAWRVSGRLS